MSPPHRVMGQLFFAGVSWERFGLEDSRGVADRKEYSFQRGNLRKIGIPKFRIRFLVSASFQKGGGRGGRQAGL